MRSLPAARGVVTRHYRRQHCLRGASLLVARQPPAPARAMSTSGAGVARPDPSWRPGQGARVGAGAAGHGAGDFVSVAPQELPADRSAYALLISAVVPRPVAFVSTLSPDGRANLAPFSYFGLLCHDPPTLAFCTTRRAGAPKDTLANVLRTNECVVNLISDPFLEAANHCSGEYAPELDEFVLSGLSKLPSESLPLKTPRCAEALVQMECVVTRTEDLVGRAGMITATVITCLVKLVHVHKSAHRVDPRGNDYVDLAAFQPVGRLGGNDYARIALQDVITMARPPADPAKWTPPVPSTATSAAAAAPAAPKQGN